jgi:putative nucleotidyltransferase with HDIG domain
MIVQERNATDAKPPTLAALVNRIQDVSTLPHVIARTLQVINDPDASALRLKNVIETDAALSVRILRCVNSSAYSLRQEVTSLQHAITFLGLKEIRRLAVTARVSELFAHDEAFGPYRRRGLWKHLVAVGLCARLIAMRQRMADFEDAFLAGLLHDVGIILEDQYVHAQFRAVVGSLDNHTPLVEAERSVLGFDHAQVGAAVAERWRFPESVKAAIGYHHASGDYQGESLAIVRCVEVANLICTVKGYSSVGLRLVEASPATIQALSLNREHLLVLAEDLDNELAKNANLLDF